MYDRDHMRVRGKKEGKKKRLDGVVWIVMNMSMKNMIDEHRFYL